MFVKNILFYLYGFKFKFNSDSNVKLKNEFSSLNEAKKIVSISKGDLNI